MNIAYLTTVYPSVSHTFIRREILELERRGHSIRRFSIREPDTCVDPVDKEELLKTFYCLGQPKLKILWRTFATLLTHPAKWIEALITVLKFSLRSERGLVTHLAYLAEACALLAELEFHNIDHVHVHFGTNATTVAVLIKILGDISYSFTAHGPDEFDAPIGFSLAEKIKCAEFVVAISHYGAAQLKRWAELSDWNKIIVVGCTVNSEFLSESSADVEVKDNQIVCVARLSAQKGIFILLDALFVLKQKNINLNLILAGDGELREIIEQRIRELDLVKNVTITGWIDGKEVKKYILGSKAFVMASFAEGLPVVIMEAFALKKPVLTTWVAGIPELVKHNRNGWLYPPNDINALVNALIEFTNTSEHKLKQMGKAGFQDVMLSHSVDSEIPVLESAFLKVTKAK